MSQEMVGLIAHQREADQLEELPKHPRQEAVFCLIGKVSNPKRHFVCNVDVEDYIEIHTPM
jgi:hypothetical protein